ncbi:MAG: PKD domain-containing protein, partial [Planktothrix sp.]
MSNYLKNPLFLKSIILNATLVSLILGCRPTPEANSQPEVIPEPVNYSPVVSAGFPQFISPKNSVELYGNVTYLGDSKDLKTQWKKITGPGTVTFTNATNPNTKAEFSQPGTYVLELTATGAKYSSQDQVTVQVNSV